MLLLLLLLFLLLFVFVLSNAAVVVVVVVVDDDDDDDDMVGLPPCRQFSEFWSWRPIVFKFLQDSKLLDAFCDEGVSRE